MDEDEAAALSSHVGYLNLSSLSEISTPVASYLAQHMGGLDLRGVESLSYDATKALSSHTAYLNLSGLHMIPEEAFEFLVQHPGSLDISGLEYMTESSVSILARRGDVRLPGEDQFYSTILETVDASQ